MGGWGRKTSTLHGIQHQPAISGRTGTGIMFTTGQKEEEDDDGGGATNEIKVLQSWRAAVCNDLALL